MGRLCAVVAACAALLTAGSATAGRGLWLTAPANGATVPQGQPIMFEFGTDLMTGIFPGKLKFEIARDPVFSDLVVAQEFPCPPSFDEPTCPSTTTIQPLPSGSYFWRISWLVVMEIPPPSWLPSESWSFTVGPEAPPPLPNAPPVARIGFEPAHPRPGELVAFDGTSSADSDGSIVDYAWTFGNGNGAAGSPLAGAAFDQPGTYIVRLVVTDNEGAASDASVEVTVAEPVITPPPPPAEPPPPPPAEPPPSTPPGAPPPPPDPPPAPPAEQPATPSVQPAADTTAPVARALLSEGRAGGIVKLRYRVRDASGIATVEAVVRGRQRVLARLRATVAARGSLPRFFLWRAPGQAQRLTLCVKARDASGNRSSPSCAPVRVRA